MKTAAVRQHEAEPLHRTVRSLTTELLTVYEELALLYCLEAQIGRLTREDQILAVALREAMDTLSADCGWAVLCEGATSRVPETCCLGIEERIVEHINRTVLEPLHFQNKSQVFMHSLKGSGQNSRRNTPGPFLASSLSVGQISLGYLCLGRHQKSRTFNSADQKLITAVAQQTAVMLENVRLQRSEWEKQRMASELMLARDIQRTLLPQDFSFAKFLNAAGLSEPCREIGGDYFDLIPLGSDLVLLVIADVTGKGAAAALQATMVQGIVYGVSGYSLDPPSLMSTLNECILKRAVDGSFVTAFLATLDSRGTLRYTNGGHNPPLLIEANGRVTELSEGGLLLGLRKSTAYPEGSIQLTAGDLLLLYTDGVTDAEDPDGNPFGIARLLDWASHQAGRLPGEVKDSLFRTVDQFSRGARQFDDLTVLIVRYSGSLRCKKSDNHLPG
jgi:serine phosphatase RsbU (regulator of sigma subunit)